jgi:8-oxo-dGTP diphosphatase
MTGTVPPAPGEPGPAKRHLVVDAANVVGSQPNGWWRDRKKAAQRLIESLSDLAQRGLPSSDAAAAAATDTERAWPEIVVVTEGQAKGAADPQGRVRVVAAERDGDQAIVDTVRQLMAHNSSVLVVTADRGLQSRVEELGATVVGPSWLREHLRQD